MLTMNPAHVMRADRKLAFFSTAVGFYRLSTRSSHICNLSGVVGIDYESFLMWAHTSLPGTFLYLSIATYHGCLLAMRRTADSAWSGLPSGGADRCKTQCTQQVPVVWGRAPVPSTSNLNFAKSARLWEAHQDTCFPRHDAR